MTMRVRYIGNPLDPEDGRQTLEAFGLVFDLGESVDVSSLSEDQQRRLRSNSHFEEVKRGRRPKSSEAEEPEADDDEC